MSVKNVVLIALVLANLLLLTAVVVQISEPAGAKAQVVAGGNNFAVVAAKFHAGQDGVWILNLKSRQLSALQMPQGNRKQMKLLASRDLLKDFRGRD
jgi:hypothetical protein